MSGAYSFTGKTVLVVGAGSGIGRASALKFSELGGRVIAVGRRESGVDQTVERIIAGGGQAYVGYADVAKQGEVVSTIAAVTQKYGELDIAVNSAGVFAPPSPLGDVQTRVWDESIGTNLSGTFYLLRAEIQSMLRNGSGTIVNLSSNIGAHSRRPGLGPYVASKAGVSALSAVAALDYIQHGIRINAVSPGSTATRMSFRPGETERDRAARLRETVPIRRIAEIDEVVNAILWLASDESSFVVGQDIVVDGGMTA